MRFRLRKELGSREPRNWKPSPSSESLALEEPATSMTSRSRRASSLARCSSRRRSAVRRGVGSTGGGEGERMSIAECQDSLLSLSLSTSMACCMSLPASAETGNLCDDLRANVACIALELRDADTDEREAEGLRAEAIFAFSGNMASMQMDGLGLKEGGQKRRGSRTREGRISDRRPPLTAIAIAMEGKLMSRSPRTSKIPERPNALFVLVYQLPATFT